MKAVALLLVAVVAVSAYSELEYQTLFTRWVASNDKTYQHEEFFSRYNTFKANLDWINANNAANKSYTVTMNKFGDLSTAEFGQKMCGYKPALRTEAARVGEVDVDSFVGASVNWVTKGAVTPVKDQGQCGSCWAFSATGGIEGAVFVAGKGLTSVAEQQLVDCAGTQGNQGCNGGLMDYAFQYVIKNGGIGSEASYKYTARDGTCKKVPSVSTIKSFTDVAAGDEAALMVAVNTQPISIAIEADQACFQFYQSGVLDDASCGTNLDHGVLLAGYDTDAASGKDYWLVKNSWGSSWGDKGYIKFVRGKNQCGLTLAASYPTA
jgi:C1A family cysteine protease